ncbi:MAG TPA: V4R domain-containing protein [Gemmatimonadales bacterium]|nr:V4R domain-containing protein [Gemmatimonadales bacterium]
MTPPPPPFDLAIGRGTLRQLHASLVNHAPDQAIAILQEAGYAAGEAIYQAFGKWLADRTAGGVDSPGNLDSELLTEMLSEFFNSGGWGTVTLTPIGTNALAIDSADWAEAEPGSAQAPMCSFSAGMLADFLGRISDDTVAVLEVECRSKGDGRCRFLSAPPDVLDKVYNEMTAGRTYAEALGA